MRSCILLVSILFFGVRSLCAQVDSIASVRDVDNIYTATAKTTKMNIDLSSPEDVELVLKKIHTFKYLESINFEGACVESDLKKLFYRLSVLKNVSAITFNENELTKIPDNIVSLKNLQSLTIIGNSDLDLADLFSNLKATKISQLNLIDNDLKKVPAAIAELSTLKKLQISGSNQLDYTDLVEHLSKINLTTLSIPLNYITELPKNIDKLTMLQVLDVSNNNLAELPGEVSGLKTINNLSIQGNLLLDPVKDLEKLKGNKIQYLSLDKEISSEELEQIKKMFPDVTIDFPVNKEDETADLKKPEEPIAPTVYTGELSVLKETTVLSGAYLSYPTFFQGLAYGFDTLSFEERYLDLRYENTRQLVSGRRTTASLYMRTSCLRLEKPGKKDETWFRFATDNPLLAGNYPELRAFSGMYWVYKGDLSKKKFKKKFLIKRELPDYNNFLWFWKRKQKKPIMWNNARIEYNKNNSLFTITLKSDTGFISFPAYPMIPELSIERSQQTYYRRYGLYKRALLRRTQRFNKQLARDKARYDRDYKVLKNYAWQSLQLRMSNGEKAMPMEIWLKYYDNIIANEQKALDKTSLSQNYILRSLQIRSYTVVVSNLALTGQSPDNFGNKLFNIDFLNAADDGKLAVANIYIINKNKIVEQYNGTLGLAPNVLSLKQFTGQRLLVELRNGNWGFISTQDLDEMNHEPNKVFVLRTQLFDKNLDTIGDLLGKVLK
jgi:hypothetical protein